MTLQTYEGGCHCGRIRFEIDVDLGAAEILDCNCSICTKKGFLHLIVPPEHFRLLQGDDAISEYRFGTKQAVHKFCRTCGVHPFYTPRSHPDDVDVNVRALEGVEIGELEITPFDGRNWEDNVEGIR
ncbi:GFA family protein [Persicimonas caeni]|uniref:GFA family protein n=1 Tax=Persicimonas caeni TaxID=2292766 RepID=A0A4Y6PQF8_PERCE|nr:GFA family protein [Persicimonas caeni]QDG50015.1 GFA family protein [Persicimonas caeni]QED31236.1 GFA family protein [Persicimonas caeni]